MDLVASCERLPRAGETVAGRDFARHPGGKGANQAVACARLGSATVLVGALGDDAFGEELRSFLAGQGVDVDRLERLRATPSGVAFVIVDAQGENQIIVVLGANRHVSEASAQSLPLRAGDVALAQLEVPIETTLAFLEHARAAGATTIFNPAPALEVPGALLQAADVLVVNETELSFYLAQPPIQLRAAEALAAAERLRRRADQTVVVTLGEQGAVASLGGGRSLSLPAHAVQAVDTTGAGDTFVGALADGLARGSSIEEALFVANAAAALSVQRHGAAQASPTRAELDAFMASGAPTALP